MTHRPTGSPSALPLIALATVLSARSPARADPAVPTAEQLFSYDALCVRDDLEHGWRPCRGSAHDEISYADFYRITGRQDLVAADPRAGCGAS